jgi:hypothetical protein
MGQPANDCRYWEEVPCHHIIQCRPRSIQRYSCRSYRVRIFASTVCTSRLGDEDQSASKLPTRLHIGEGVTDDYGPAEVNLWEITLGLLKHPHIRFAASTLPLVVRAIVDRVYRRTGGLHFGDHFGMERLEALDAEQSSCYGTLVRHDDNSHSRISQHLECDFRVWQELKCIPRKYIV